MRKKLTLAAILLLALIAAPSTAAQGALDALKGAIGALTGNKGQTAIDAGTWKYTGPGISFKSDNALKNLGGAAAGTAIEAKIKPYYDKLGLQNMTFEVAQDSTFTMKVKKLTLKGTIVYGESGQCTLQMQALGKIPAGKYHAQWQQLGSSLVLTFDVSRLVSLIQTIASVSGQSSLKSVSEILKSYDGIYAGFRFKK